MVVQWNLIKSTTFSRPNSSVSDVFTWCMCANDAFSTKSIYQHLERNVACSHNKWIWKAQIPLKLKIFLWLLFKNAILTRDNLKKCKCLGSPLCLYVACGKVLLCFIVFI
jgi:hypothetical protein